MNTNYISKGYFPTYLPIGYLPLGFIFHVIKNFIVELVRTVEAELER